MSQAEQQASEAIQELKFRMSPQYMQNPLQRPLHPLAIGAVVVTIGAALAAAFPRSRQKDGWETCGKK